MLTAEQHLVLSRLDDEWVYFHQIAAVVLRMRWVGCPVIEIERRLGGRF